METNNGRPVYGIEEYKEVPDKTTARDFSIGLAFGLAVGTIGGLLLAPKSGDALRDDIQGQADKLTKNLSVDDADIEALKRKAELKTNQLRRKLNDGYKQNSETLLQSDVAEAASESAVEQDTASQASQSRINDFSQVESGNGKTVDMKQYVSKSGKDKSE